MLWGWGEVGQSYKLVIEIWSWSQIFASSVRSNLSILRRTSGWTRLPFDRERWTCRDVWSSRTSRCDLDSFSISGMVSWTNNLHIPCLRARLRRVFESWLCEDEIYSAADHQQPKMVLQRVSSAPVPGDLSVTVSFTIASQSSTSHHSSMILAWLDLAVVLPTSNVSLLPEDKLNRGLFVIYTKFATIIIGSSLQHFTSLFHTCNLWINYILITQWL